jgi:hypothetical protein
MASARRCHFLVAAGSTAVTAAGSAAVAGARARRGEPTTSWREKPVAGVGCGGGAEIGGGGSESTAGLASGSLLRGQEAVVGRKSAAAALN